MEIDPQTVLAFFYFGKTDIGTLDSMVIFTDKIQYVDNLTIVYSLFASFYVIIKKNMT